MNLSKMNDSVVNLLGYFISHRDTENTEAAENTEVAQRSIGTLLKI